VRIVRESEQKWTPWKNGGGRTVEIAHGPAGAGLDNFDWRISRARVERAGPFSFFPGIDRTLAVLHGENLRLRIDQAEPVVLSVNTPPLSFAGEARVESEVIQPITDLNVMTRRGRFLHRLTAFVNGEPVGVSANMDGISAVFTTGAADIRWAQGEDRLQENDAAFLSVEDGRVDVFAGEAARLYLIEIWPAGI
jgi:environmental stress-induced protein Ves